MRLIIEVTLDEAQWTKERAERLRNETAFVVEGVIGQERMDSRGSRDFDYDITTRLAP